MHVYSSGTTFNISPVYRPHISNKATFHSILQTAKHVFQHTEKELKIYEKLYGNILYN